MAHEKNKTGTDGVGHSSARFLSSLKLNPYEIAAIGIIAFAAVLRLVLMSYGWPETDSDESTMGLEAMHIAFRGEHPIFLYGQNYMGVAEAYVGALMFRLFGVSLFSLRLGMLLLFIGFLIVFYLLTRLLYPKKLALISLLLLSVGARNVLLPEMRAVGGAVETLVCGTLLLLLATWLALSFYQKQEVAGRRWRRYAAYAGWGLTVSIGLWSHMLVGPFVLASAFLLVLFCWRELRGKAVLFLLAGLLIGGIPLIAYNLTAPFGDNSLAVLWQLHQTIDPNAPTGFLQYEKQIVGTLLYSLPVATGFSPICSLQELPLYGPPSSQTLYCAISQGGWSLGYIGLLAVATWLTGTMCLKSWRFLRSASAGISIEDRQHNIILTARLALLCCAIITLLLFVLSPIAATRPWSTRYLIGLSIALPAVIWPLWRGLIRAPARECPYGFGTVIWPLWRRISRAPARGCPSHTNGLDSFYGRGIPLRVPLLYTIRYILFMLIGAELLIGTAWNFVTIPDIVALNQQRTALVSNLERLNITRMYGGYWTCDLVIFESQEKILCSVVDEQVRSGLNRYPAYQAAVRRDPQAAYVFPQGSNFDANFRQKMAQEHMRYRRYDMDGYVVYVPV